LSVTNWHHIDQFSFADIGALVGSAALKTFRYCGLEAALQGLPAGFSIFPHQVEYRRTALEKARSLCLPLLFLLFIQALRKPVGSYAVRGCTIGLCRKRLLVTAQRPNVTY